MHQKGAQLVLGPLIHTDVILVSHVSGYLVQPSRGLVLLKSLELHYENFRPRIDRNFLVAALLRAAACPILFPAHPLDADDVTW